MKKIVSVLLAVIMVAGLCVSMPAASAAVVKENYFVTRAKAEKSLQSLQKKALLGTGDLQEFAQTIENYDQMISEMALFLTKDSLKTITGYLNDAKAVLQKENSTEEERLFSLTNIAMSLSLDKEIDQVNKYLNHIIKQTQDLIDSFDKLGLEPEIFEELKAILEQAVALKDKGNFTVEDVESLNQRLEKIITDYKKENLIDKIDWANYYIKCGKYTDEELVDLKQALENAQQILDKENATAEEFQDAYYAIIEATSKLPYKTTKIELQNMIEEAKNYLDEDLYYTEELETLKQGLNAAEQVIADNSATDFYDAYMNIYGAMIKLRRLDNNFTVEDIQQLIDQALGYINSGDLTQDKIKSELEFAKSVVEKEDPLPKEKRKAYNELNNAVKPLLGTFKRMLKFMLINVEDNYIENPETYQIFSQESIDTLLQVYDASKAIFEDVNSTEGDHSVAFDKLYYAIYSLKVGRFGRVAMKYQINMNTTLVIKADQAAADVSYYKKMRSNILKAQAIYLDETSTDKAIEDIMKLLISDYDKFENPTDILYGDYNMDDKVNIRDATDVQKVILEYKDAADFDLKAGDVDGNGVINIRDATSIQKWVLEYIDVFPVENQDNLS